MDEFCKVIKKVADDERPNSKGPDDFLRRCKDRLKITDDDTFLRIYYYGNYKKHRNRLEDWEV